MEHGTTGTTMQDPGGLVTEKFRVFALVCALGPKFQNVAGEKIGEWQDDGHECGPKSAVLYIR